MSVLIGPEGSPWWVMEGERAVTVCHGPAPVCALRFDGHVVHDRVAFPWPQDTYVHAVADVLTFISRMPFPRI